ncbi:MAG: hypothetical protein IJ136_06425 [Erysipelotrichaceae bacterium]|nr:hypothetical protein [Erysipelotrichaceae bacterium]
MKNIHTDLLTGEITITKSFYKKSTVYGSPEYVELKKTMSENPNFKVVVRSISKKANKRTHRNMTYENMRQFIEVENRDLLPEYERVIAKSVIARSKYHYVLAWFETTFSTHEKYETYFPVETKTVESEATA